MALSLCLLVPADSAGLQSDRLSLFQVHYSPDYYAKVDKTRYETQIDESGNVKTVIYKGRMEAGEYTAFPFIALNPAKPDTTVKYQVYVTYEDGVVVPFDGSESAKGYQPTILLK